MTTPHFNVRVENGATVIYASVEGEWYRMTGISGELANYLGKTLIFASEHMARYPEQNSTIIFNEFV